MQAKRFFYVCAGVLMFALAYHLGASRAGAQSSGGGFAGITITDGPNGGSTVAITVTGDIYGRPGAPTCFNGNVPFGWSPTSCSGEWVFMGNVLAGGTVQTQAKDWSAVKDGYRSK